MQIPGRGWDKINTSFEGGVSGGGPLRVAQTIHRLTGLKVNHFLYVDLLGFQQVVDTLGSGDVHPVRRAGSALLLDLKAGCQTLDGRQALGYVRTRHLPCDAAAPDLSRIGRQQQFLRAVINQLLAPQQIVRAPGLVKPVLASLKRDDDLRSPTSRTWSDVSVDSPPAPSSSALSPRSRAWSSHPGSPRSRSSTPTPLRAPSSGRSGTAPRSRPRGPSDQHADVAGEHPRRGSRRRLGRRRRRVADILSTSGFDVSPGIIPLGDPASGWTGR